jgi:DNA primase
VGEIDTELLKRAHSVEMVIARYGIDLRPSGQTLVGRCPFHPDGGRPNMYVYPASRSWFCYRCWVGGDVISFVRRMEGLGFREAVARLIGEPPIPLNLVGRLDRQASQHGIQSSAAGGPEERACLAAAVEVYHSRLQSDAAARTYLEARGADQETAEHYQLGYVRGDELGNELGRRRLPVQAAIRAGLLGRDGREIMAGRIVVPEIRGGRPIWLIGRSILAGHGGPKYLSLPGPKPLLGWETASAASTVYVTEGPFDWLTLRRWSYPAMALVGTHVRPEALASLARFERICLVLDTDQAGQAAAAELVRTLGERAVSVVLPLVKDVSELGRQPDGSAIFAQTLRQPSLVQAA